MLLTSILVPKAFGPVLMSLCPLLIIGYIFLQGGGDILPPVLRSLTLDDFIKSKAKVLHFLDLFQILLLVNIFSVNFVHLPRGFGLICLTSIGLKFHHIHSLSFSFVIFTFISPSLKIRGVFDKISNQWKSSVFS